MDVELIRCIEVMSGVSDFEMLLRTRVLVAQSSAKCQHYIPNNPNIAIFYLSRPASA